MNRFKTKKKGAKEDVVDARPSLESESSFSLFRRGKKNSEPETKKEEIDLASALPSNDDFRTSLLMNGLSARFSMLREQDDPNSKIGKASDDSVLYPKRQSRFADFGFASGKGLVDIAEDESIKPPSFLRKDSNASYDSSMMTRSRPMESNVLFGGRQKIYKVGPSKNTSDGISGRVLYDGDVGTSLFQKWRLAEKDKEQDISDEHEHHEDDKVSGDRSPEESAFPTRSESPVPHGYNKKRETSSTTSSTPSIGRNSTAATSVVSQPTAMTKDGSSSPNSTPGLERHVTRTRKLYEQGLHQNLQDQQHSVLTRVDTLARRPAGTRTPELGPHSPSPTTQTFNDRWAPFASERRTISSKGSAPNLRSVSSTATGSPAIGSLNRTMTLNTSISNGPDAKGGVLMSPPLSPPISDAGTGEHVNLHIQPRDLGKATAMNVFQKPTSPYDDSKYTERMRQLQQGRETPAWKSRDDLNASIVESRSQSAASTHRVDSEITTMGAKLAPRKADAPAQSHSNERTFFDENIESPIVSEFAPQTPEFRIERPSDQDHPAFRSATTPTPLVFPSAGEPQSTGSRTPDFHSLGPQPKMLADSPTLGPTTGGLSGLVRQHLRTESDVSSIYGQSPQPSPRREDSTPLSRDTREALDSEESRTNSGEHSSLHPKPSSQAAQPSSDYSRMQGTFLDSARSPDEETEFADQLANARRRVREKLTSFVETDPSYAYSPPIMADQAADVSPPPSRSNPLGILRGKGSRGSLIDRSVSDRGRDGSRPAREHGLSDETERRLNEEEDAHPSLRAFRQVRREVQKRKELEAGMTGSPYSRPLMTSPPIDEHVPLDNIGRREVSRTPSGDRQHVGSRHPRHLAREIPEETPSPPSRSRSRAARDRSGSENSEGSNRSRSRQPPRSREHVHPPNAPPMPSEMPNAQSPRRPTARSPGLPGTDIRGSSILPPVAARSGLRSTAPGPYQGGFNDPANLKSLPGRAMTEPLSSGPFSSSPLPGRAEHQRAFYPSNSAPGSAPGSGTSTPAMPPSRRPSVPSNPHANISGSTLTDAMKRVINKKDISEPTFVMSTSRVPTTDIPQDARGTRSRSGSVANSGSPPPLPPVNPRRKRDTSRTRTLINGIMGSRRGDETDVAAYSMSTPQLPLSTPPVPPFSEQAAGDYGTDDDEARPAPRRLRKASSELRLDRAASVANPTRVSPPQVAIGPPAGRAVMVRGGPSPNMNGGMF
ncbi:hypothetical protein N0V93_002845 [Gnomoniopsis smithogilvyi]|uniref:Uncharacterized protein n=1 Tax=Gnomoniopsis smithogilvyi TaxID=1191159 RepID=A0A9W8YW11_9PEZI|nr:hypothetical protein N0V93_002845 [Gnomoniopsis smithogilvyi]